MTDTTQRDVVDLLSADHREFDAIFTQLEALVGRTGPDDLRRKRRRRRVDGREHEEALHRVADVRHEILGKRVLAWSRARSSFFFSP